MVREQHRLGTLQVGVARHDHVEVVFGLLDQRVAQHHIGRHQVLAALLGEQARVGGHLVVAAAPRVQARAGVPDVLDERPFHRHVDVLVVDVEGERARIDAYVANIRRWLPYIG